MKIFKRVVLLLTITISAPLAQIPELINYQGQVNDTSGDPISGEYRIEFRIYDQLENGVMLWNEQHEVNVSNGIFSVLLGSLTNFEPGFFDAAELYLTLKIGDDPEMAPRKQITSVAYAFRSENSDSLNGYSSDDFVKSGQENAVTTEMVEDNFISSLNSVGNDGGNIDLVAGTNVSITPNDAQNKITISAIADGDTAGDNFGNHTATQNIQTNFNWISCDGDNEGLFISSRGRVGIGTDNPNYDLDVEGRIRAVSDWSYTLVCENNNAAGSAGYFWQKGNFGKGVYALNDGRDGKAVSGIARGDNSTGIMGYAIGVNSYGVKGETASEEGSGVYGYASDDGAGEKYGGFFRANGENGIGVYGEARNSSGYTFGGYFESESDDGRGVYGYATGDRGIGILGSSDYYAGMFTGDVSVIGTLSKSAGSFKIDHPLDPDNKYLQHSFVESPDMKNVYDGTVRLDGNGEIVVTLPDYFDALNKDFRYQLTAIGAPGPNLYIAEEIHNNQFKIAGGNSNMKVSWMVTGIRNDAYAQNHRIEVEVPKEGNEQGKYLFPKEHNQPESMGLYDEEDQRLKKQQQKEKIRLEQDRMKNKTEGVER